MRLLRKTSLICQYSRRYLGSQASGGQGMIDDMVAFARQQCKGDPEQALDVLKTGLAMPDDLGNNTGRLKLAMAEVEAQRNRWDEAAEHSLSAQVGALKTLRESESGHGTAARIVTHSTALALRSVMVQGSDEAAEIIHHIADSDILKGDIHDRLLQLAGTPDAGALGGLALSFTSSAGSYFHSLGAFASAKENMSSILSEEKSSGFEHIHPYVRAEASRQAASFFLATGDFTTAGQEFERAASTAKELTFVTSPDIEGSPVLAAESLAGALLGSAQVAMEEKRMDAAEKFIEQALSAAESVANTGERHIRVAPILILMGSLYARTARITFAEGLYREAAKYMRIGTGGESADEAGWVHPSLGVLLGWRFHQLLTVMPRREKEAAEWAALAESRWAKCAGNDKDVWLKNTLSSLLGPPDMLKGGSAEARGLVVDLPTRRALLTEPSGIRGGSRVADGVVTPQGEI